MRCQHQKMTCVLPHPTVLIVEDEYLASLQLRDSLESIGCHIVGEASDGTHAIEQALSLHPDYIIMDIQMPSMSGIEATRQIQQRCPVPVILVTSHCSPELMTEASAAGACAYLMKPTNPHELARTMTIASARFRELQQLREDRRILWQEIHHRTRNNMQVMSSLLALQASCHDEPSVSRLLKNFQARIQAMALVHEKLYRADLTTVNLEAYLRELVRELWQDSHRSPDDIRVEWRAEPVLLPIDTAIPFGLVSHELLSNVVHHAFPDQASGQVVVALHADAERMIHFMVSDTGCGHYDAILRKKPTTFGLRLIEILLEHQLGGVLDIQPMSPGIRVCVQCKPPHYAQRIATAAPS